MHGTGIEIKKNSTQILLINSLCSPTSNNNNDNDDNNNNNNNNLYTECLYLQHEATRNSFSSSRIQFINNLLTTSARWSIS